MKKKNVVREKEEEYGLLLIINMGTESQPASQGEIGQLQSEIKGVFDQYGIVGAVVVSTGISSVSAFTIPFNK